MPKRQRAEYMRLYRARKREEARLKRIKEAEARGEYNEENGEMAIEEEPNELIKEEPKEPEFTGVPIKEEPNLLCIVCGISFNRECCGSERFPKFCSKVCRREWNQMRSKEREKLLEAFRATDYYQRLRGKEKW